MTTVTFNVPNIHCGNCVNTIQMELSDVDGVSSVIANNETKQVEVTFDAPVTEEALVALLAEINFPATN